MERDMILAAGLILLVASFIMYLLFNPRYTSFSNRLAGYDTPSLDKSEYEFYTLLNATILPILNILTAIGATLLLLGLFTSEKE